jgi:hypothetical protein
MNVHIHLDATTLWEMRKWERLRRYPLAENLKFVYKNTYPYRHHNTVGNGIQGLPPSISI